MKKNFLPAMILILTFNSINLFAQNTKLGTNALAGVTTGNYNTALGYYSLYSNTTGNYNSATGAYSLYYNKTGLANTANGTYSLFRNSTGNYNKADGYAALYFNTTGGYNTALGSYALYNNSTANYNTATGSHSLYNNTTGVNNTANGYSLCMQTIPGIIILPMAHNRFSAMQQADITPPAGLYRCIAIPVAFTTWPMAQGHCTQLLPATAILQQVVFLCI